MAMKDNDVIDSQFLAENVGFLENCFDNSFALQTSLVVVRDYIAEECHNTSGAKQNSVLCKKLNSTVQHKPALDTSSFKNAEILSQLNEKKVINKKLKDWGLPFEIARKYEQRGITDMFEWQVTCLGNPKVLLECSNLVYSAPTSAGKTLVAEILTIKTILERQKKVIIILPFVSIVREKMFYLQDILSSSGIRVEGFMGSQSPPGGLQAVHVAICTIEKANSLVNRLLDEGNISDLGAVIVDELHLLGDPHRGYILELLLTKIKYVSSKLDVQIQIVGMSATLPNLEVLANWLDAELFITQFRPIPLDEYCLVGSRYYDKHGECVDIVKNLTATAVDTDIVLKVCLDTIKEGCSVLIFCMTKNRCENLAQSISASFYNLGCKGSEMGLVLREQLKQESIIEVLEQLKNCPVGLDQVLKNTISFGVAYHHAGLTFDERDIIEGGFKSGAIRVLVATSTLSSGVNLPARKVIIRSPVFQRQPINILTYKQMIGRAGRMGKDTKGESILICSEAEKNIGFDLMMGALEPVKSCIESEDKYMRAVLEMIASQVVSTKSELDLYSRCTLLFTQQHGSLSQNTLLENTLDELRNYELVRIQDDGEDKHYVATPLGKACLSSSMTPNDGLSLFCELQKARQCLVLETDLHLIYLVTPYSVSSQWGDIDWLHLLTLWESLTKAMKRVGELVGVQESFIIRCLRGANKANNVQNKLNIHKRFYTALALQDLVNEVPLSEVATKFQCARGFLQSLQQAAATFAGMVTAFCHQLGWKNMEMLISQFQDRLHFGIHSELLELMKLPSLNGVRARTLFDAGFETITSIASADVNVIENALHRAVPFQSEKEREGDDVNDMRKRNKIKHIWITGCCGMTTKEAAEKLISEARQYLEHEIGVNEIKWNKTDPKNEVPLPTVDDDQRINNNILQLLPIKEESKTQATSITNNVTKENGADESICLTNNICKSEHKSLTNEYECVNKNNELSQDLIPQNKIKFENNDDNVLSNSKEDVLSNDNSQIPLNSLKDTKVCGGSNLSCLTKDDIIWDSLNITEAAFNNISKLRKSDLCSPNMSFGDVEDKIVLNSPKATKTSNSLSMKDISLFSSDGDNSSLFEDSLPLDLIPSKLLRDDEVQVTKLQDLKTTECVTINTISILNAFKSSIIEINNEEEDLKLVYDEENKVADPKKDSNNAIMMNKVNTRLTKDTVSPHKRQAETNYTNFMQPLPKKAKLLSQTIKRADKKFSFAPSMNCSRSKLIMLKILQTTLSCYMLRGNDILDNLQHIIDNIYEAAIHFDIKNTTVISNEVIGSNIVKPSVEVRKTNNVKLLIQAIAIYFGHEKCVVLDLKTLEKGIALIKQKLGSWFQRRTLKLKMMSLMSTYVQIKRCFGIDLQSNCVDIGLSEWLIHSDERLANIFYFAKKYQDLDLSTTYISVDSSVKRYKNLDSLEELCVKAWCVWSTAEKQEKYLLEQYETVKNTIAAESHVLKILATCEHNGLVVDKNLASQLLIDVKNSQEVLQKKAYKICGYHFNFNSSKDVAKVLGIYKGRKVSTKKSVLASHDSPISSIVIYWRKLNSILTKTLYPLTEKACIYSDGNRINPSYTTHTCTGRISMHEPNLQNVPRTFWIPMRYLSLEEDSCDDIVEFNCRNIFRAAAGHVLVSADYCQLEMRILTHYCGDALLTRIMSSDVDVFKSIAASWCNVLEDEVDDDLRQKAKQLCYGILYGMGNRTLSQHLDVSEMEAAMFMDTFYKTYPAIQTFTQSVLEECRKRGYVETLMKRRRYLPDIRSHIPSKKSSAERQAVNTTIQGSAADIAKAAMCAIDARTDGDNKPKLILQMHDELIYEVPESRKQWFISIIKEVMEGTVRLNVPLPVKVKMGRTWGTLAEVQV